MSPETLMILAGLALHGIATLGGGVAFLIRNEHRMTKFESELDAIRNEIGGRLRRGQGRPDKKRDEQE